MTGISRTRPISKNIGRPMIAPTSAIAHGRARGDACPTMVSTISSAPPESASSLANIAPSAIRMPTPAAVVPNPSAKDSRTLLQVLAGDDADRQGAEDQREERVQLDHGDQHDDQRDAGEGGQDQLPAGGDGFGELGRRRRGRDRSPIVRSSVLLFGVERVNIVLDDGVDVLVDVDDDAALVRLRAARGCRTGRPAARRA